MGYYLSNRILFEKSLKVYVFYAKLQTLNRHPLVTLWACFPNFWPMPSALRKFFVCVFIYIRKLPSNAPSSYELSPYKVVQSAFELYGSINCDSHMINFLCIELLFVWNIRLVLYLIIILNCGISASEWLIRHSSPFRVESLTIASIAGTLINIIYLINII